MRETTQAIRNQAFLPLTGDIPEGLTLRQYRARAARAAAPRLARAAPGCGWRSASLGRMAELPGELTPRQVAELIGDGGAQLVDVREPFEHEAGRIAGDLHIELERLTAEAGSIDRERPVVFYCRSGSRSALAAQAFGAVRLQRAQPHRRPQGVGQRTGCRSSPPTAAWPRARKRPNCSNKGWLAGCGAPGQSTHPGLRRGVCRVSGAMREKFDKPSSSPRAGRGWADFAWINPMLVRSCPA